MFCPSCGNEYTIELKYCNRCGANLSVGLISAPEVVQVNVTKPVLILGLAVLFLTLGGFAGVISGAMETVRNAGGGDLSIAIIFFGMITILVVDILLIRLLSKVITASLTANKLIPGKRTISNSQPQLEYPRSFPAGVEPVPSVTDHTTRFFEPAYRGPSESPNPKSSNE